MEKWLIDGDDWLCLYRLHGWGMLLLDGHVLGALMQLVPLSGIPTNPPLLPAAQLNDCHCHCRSREDERSNTTVNQASHTLGDKT